VPPLPARDQRLTYRRPAAIVLWRQLRARRGGGKRLKGFEPTIFCMASKRCASAFVPNRPTTAGFSLRDGLARFHGIHGRSRGFPDRNRTGPRRHKPPGLVHPGGSTLPAFGWMRERSQPEAIRAILSQSEATGSTRSSGRAPFAAPGRTCAQALTTRWRPSGCTAVGCERSARPSGSSICRRLCSPSRASTVT
jgi:hypothetical protein